MEVSMRKVVVSEFPTLDGVVEDPSWTFQFSSEEQPKYQFDELVAADALLLGRVTYQGFADSWPNMMDQYEGPDGAVLQEYTDMINGYPKHVVSKTLEEPLGWNNSTLIREDVAQEVSRLKRQPGKEILIFGSADLARKLKEHGLIEDYRLMVFPIVLGSGKRLCNNGLDTTVLELVDTNTFGSGAVVLIYRPAAE